ncbi:MAG: hypothetical protein AAGC70_10150 [Pseudomonadota bacterium]
MFYFDRAQGLAYVKDHAKTPDITTALTELCNAWWDIHDRVPIDDTHLRTFRCRAMHPDARVSDWAMVGIALKSDVYEPFRALFSELLQHSEPDVRRRMASKFQRLSMNAAANELFPVLLHHSDPVVRMVAYRVCTKPLTEAAELKAQFAILQPAMDAETDQDNRLFLEQYTQRIEGLIRNAKRSRTQFDWKTYRFAFKTAVDAVILDVAKRHPSISFCGCLLYCHFGGFGDVVIQFQRADDSTDADPSEWGFDDHMDDLGVSDAFKDKWDPIASEMQDIRYDDSIAWAEGQDPEDDFMQMACSVALELEGDASVAALNKTDDFRIFVYSEEETIERSTERMGRFRRSAR